MCAKAENNEKIKYMQELKGVNYDLGVDFQRTLK